MSDSEASLSVQAHFIQQIRNQLPVSIGLAEELADTLGISTDSAYRRIRGETAFNIQEVYTLSRKYNISLDSVFSSRHDTVTFAYTKLTDNAEQFNSYLTRIHDHLAAINSFDHRHVTYIAEEVPLMYSFFSDPLVEFKIFYWQRGILNFPDVQGKKFEFGLVPKDFLALVRSCFEKYKTIPSTEVWTEETLITTIKQIEFFVDSGLFKNKEDALLVVQQVREMIHYIMGCAETGKKDPGAEAGTFQLYKSDVALGTNCIYIEAGESVHTYISFNTLNSLTTSNATFCEETEHWIKNLIRKSTLISGTSEKQRYQFFNVLMRNLDECEEHIRNS